MLEKIKKIIALWMKWASMASDIILEKDIKPMQSHLVPPQISFSPASKKVFSEIQQNELSILVWKNNSWKSLLLKQIKGKIWSWAHLIQVDRHQPFSMIPEYTPNEDEKEQLHSSFVSQMQQPQNSENIFVWLPQAIWKLHEDKVKILYQLMQSFFDISKVESKNIKEWHPFSQKYIDCDGVNLSYMSSGFRLCIYLLAVMLDDGFDTVIIDEPELGISPELQYKLSDILINEQNRKHFFPHIKKLILATHSTIFLDTSSMQNNYMIQRNGNEISIKKTTDISELRNIHFFLLGNRFETLSLPSAIVLVEWKTDKQFIDFVFAKCFPSKKINVQFGDKWNWEWWDEKIVPLAYRIANTLDIQSSPYKTRTFVLMDAKNSTKKWKLITYWFDDDNVIEFTKNGIEYYYPSQIINEIFWKKWELEIDGDYVKKGGISKTKDHLCNEVILRIDEKSKFNDEFEGFLAKLGKAIWITWIWDQ